MTPAPETTASARGAPVSDASRPTFIVAGVAKAGTTALYHYLGEHPEVYMSPVKEPCYFVPGYGPVETWEDYLALFVGAAGAKAVGEATPRYFHDPEAAGRIAEALPGVRIVVLLRQPVERALSHYVMLTNNDAAIRPEPFAAFFRRVSADPAGWKTGGLAERGLAMGFYADSIERWFDTFGRARVAVHLDDDLRAAPEHTMAAIYAFLGVDPTFRPDVSKRYNVGQGLPRSGGVQRLVYRPSALKRLAQRVLPDPVRDAARRALLRFNQGERPALTPEERRAFTAFYRDDIRRVETLIGRDLSAWLA
jgi:hypothetical protein